MEEDEHQVEEDEHQVEEEIHICYMILYCVLPN